MNTRTPFLVSLLVAGAMTVFAVVTAARLPADAVLPTHWNASGQADDWSPALQALLMPAGVFAAVAALLAIIPRLEPLQDRLEGSAPVLRASWIGLGCLFVIIQLTIGLPAYGIEVPVNMIMLGTGLMLVLLGNALPKSRPGFFVGIRTPWTITDTDNWIATHRLGGKLFMAAGALVMAVSLVPVGAEPVAIVVLVAVGFAAGIPVIYSWWLWKRKGPGEGMRREERT